MFARWLIAVCTLPGTVLVLIPIGIMWLSRPLGNIWAPVGIDTACFWLAVPFALLGGFFGPWTMSLFLRFKPCSHTT